MLNDPPQHLPLTFPLFAEGTVIYKMGGGGECVHAVFVCSPQFLAEKTLTLQTKYGPSKMIILPFLVTPSLYLHQPSTPL